MHYVVSNFYKFRHSHNILQKLGYPRNPFLWPFGTICCWLFVPVRHGFILFL